MIREGQFTPELREYINTLPPWRDSDPGYGWMVNKFYDNIYELRRKTVEELPETPTAEQMAGYLFWKYECEDITLEQMQIIGSLVCDLYEYWKTHYHMTIPEAVVNEYIAKHEADLLPTGDYIELDDILL